VQKRLEVYTKPKGVQRLSGRRKSLVGGEPPEWLWFPKGGNPIPEKMRGSRESHLESLVVDGYRARPCLGDKGREARDEWMGIIIYSSVGGTEE